MAGTGQGDERTIYTITMRDGRRVIYNAAAIGNPPDHVAGKWYWRPYPVPLGCPVGEAYDTPEETERAARAEEAGRS